MKWGSTREEERRTWGLRKTRAIKWVMTCARFSERNANGTASGDSSTTQRKNLEWGTCTSAIYVQMLADTRNTKWSHRNNHETNMQSLAKRPHKQQRYNYIYIFIDAIYSIFAKMKGHIVSFLHKQQQHWTLKTPLFLLRVCSPHTCKITWEQKNYPTTHTTNTAHRD